MDINHVVKLYVNKHIARVSMEDRENHNMFSLDLRKGLILAFQHINQDEQIKVVVLHGYDNYFCCGGTQEELLSIYEKKCNFTDLKIHDILLNCAVPVISAMQGHALGGGLAMGCFADVIILARQSIYSANFMSYGFTPGFGSTYIIPKVFGETLGREMLYTAKNFYGEELKTRQLGIEVLDRADVVESAMSVAHQMADKPRISLLKLKEHFRLMVLPTLQQYIERELSMHEVTFFQDEVLKNIERLKERQ